MNPVITDWRNHVVSLHNSELNKMKLNNLPLGAIILPPLLPEA